MRGSYTKTIPSSKSIHILIHLLQDWSHFTLKIELTWCPICKYFQESRRIEQISCAAQQVRKDTAAGECAIGLKQLHGDLPATGNVSGVVVVGSNDGKSG